MTLDFYRWPPKRLVGHSIPPTTIPTPPPLNAAEEASAYIPHPDLISAVNVALLLGKPLLITGEPGTGKTRLGNSIAWQLGFLGPFKFVAKSTSQARDLFYTYDALGRFYAVETAKQPNVGVAERRASNPLDFIEYAALGRAILTAHPIDLIRDFLPASASMEHGSTDPTVFVHPGAPRRSVVVIDEIDKAPRDFPNDLLDELDHMRFRVSEVREASTPPLEDRNLRPVVLITSNRERQLPDAFLRRCLFFEIPFPGRRSPHAGETDTYTMEDIVARRLAKSGAAFRSSPLVRDAIDFFYDMRALADPLNKRPATAELIDWLDALRHAGADPRRGLADCVDARRTLPALFKNGDDLTRGRARFDVWVLKPRSNVSQA